MSILSENDLEDLPEELNYPYNEDGFDEDGNQKIDPYIV